MKCEYKVLSGTEGEVQKRLAEHAVNSWRPILMTATATDNGSRLFVVLEHQVAPVYGD